MANSKFNHGESLIGVALNEFLWVRMPLWFEWNTKVCKTTFIFRSSDILFWTEFLYDIKFKKLRLHFFEMSASVLLFRTVVIRVLCIKG